MTDRRPTIVAHRGLHHDFPENSVEAMAAAFRAGISAVEWDVRLTADGFPVVLHDETLDRTTTASGHLAAVKWQDIAGLQLKLNDKVTACRLPLLADTYSPIADPELEGLKPEQWLFLVEIKEYKPELIRAVLDSRVGVKGHVILQSFDERVIVEIERLDESCDTAILCGNEDELNIARDAHRPRIHMHHKLATRAVIDPLHSHGVETGVWTANSAEDLRRIISLGVGMIITDEPILARKLVAE